MFGIGASQECLEKRDGGEGLQFDELGDDLAGGVVAEGKVDSEEVREGCLGGHHEILRHGGGGVLAKRRRRELADDVRGGLGEPLGGGGVEKEGSFRDAEIHRPVHRRVQFRQKRGIALLGESGVIALAKGGDHFLSRKRGGAEARKILEGELKPEARKPGENLWNALFLVSWLPAKFPCLVVPLLRASNQKLPLRHDLLVVEPDVEETADAVDVGRALPGLAGVLGVGVAEGDVDAKDLMALAAAVKNAVGTRQTIAEIREQENQIKAEAIKAAEATAKAGGGGAAVVATIKKALGIAA